MSNPLETRALPDSLWSKIPEHWIAWDIQLADWMADQVDLHSFPWKQLRYLSEDPWGIALCLLITTLFVLKKCRHRRITIIWSLVMVIIGGFLADGISSQLKELFGRLKPHVTFYNPNVTPALAFPSNHAFNSCYLWVAAYLMTPAKQRKGAWVLFLVFGVLVLQIGLTRIAFGQHHVLDVLAGWIFGTLWATLWVKVFVAPVWRKIDNNW